MRAPLEPNPRPQIWLVLGPGFLFRKAARLLLSGLKHWSLAFGQCARPPYPVATEDSVFCAPSIGAGGRFAPPISAGFSSSYQPPPGAMGT